MQFLVSPAILVTSTWSRMLALVQNLTGCIWYFYTLNVKFLTEESFNKKVEYYRPGECGSQLDCL